MDQFSDQENKGRYCQFVVGADGMYTLKPVKVPAHIKAERAERIRKREIRQHAQRNRERAQAINGGSVLFLTFAMSVFVVICCLFLGLQNQLTNRLDDIASLQSQVEQLSQDNDILESRLISAENLAAIGETATKKLGMQKVSKDQIRYYTSQSEDYMVQYSEIAK